MFTDHINAIDEDIKWTMEREEKELLEESGEDGNSKSRERAPDFMDTKTVINKVGPIGTRGHKHDQIYELPEQSLTRTQEVLLEQYMNFQNITRTQEVLYNK